LSFKDNLILISTEKYCLKHTEEIIMLLDYTEFALFAKEIGYASKTLLQFADFAAIQQ